MKFIKRALVRKHGGNGPVGRYSDVWDHVKLHLSLIDCDDVD
jgi:hypothetical protein